MNDSLQDEPQLPVPTTKGKKGLWIVLAVIGVIFLIIVFMKAGSSTKDPKKAVIDAADIYRSTTGDITSESVHELTDQMIGSDGMTQDQSGAVTDFLEKNVEKNTELANEYKLANDRKLGKYDNKLPSSLDDQGHPVRVVNRDYYAPDSMTSTAEKSIEIPKFAEGWDPEQEIIVPATDRTPAYRYRPAYLKGSNSPQRPGDLEQLDNAWLNSVGMSSYGHSTQVNAAFNANLPPVVIKQSVNYTNLIRIKGHKGIKQPIGQTSIKINNKQKWTIPAPGESK